MTCSEGFRPFVLLVAYALWSQTPPVSDHQLNHQRLMTLNVVAFDGKGQPVGDLTEDDFQIQDQGRKQQIVSFRRNESSPFASSALREHEFSSRSSHIAQHSTVILLDLLNGNMTDRGTGWEGIDRALERMQSGDNLYLYLLTASSSLYPVRAIVEAEAIKESGSGAPAEAWTRNVRAMVDQAVRKVNRLKPVEDQDPEIRIRGTYQVLGSLASQMATLPGRKNLVWITHGVPIVYLSLTQTVIDMTESLRRFCAGLNRLGIAVYSVDQGGPGTLQTGREGPGYQSQDTLETMSNLTGGHAFPSNNVETAITAAIASAQGSYLIAYRPPPENWDGKFHKVAVKCTRKGVRLQAQQGYLAAAKEPDNQMAAAYQAAAEVPQNLPGIGIRAMATHSEKGLHIALRIDPADLMLTREGERDTGQVAIGFIAVGSKDNEHPPALLNLSLSKEQLTAAMKEGLPLAYDRSFGSGVENVRIVVMDVNSLQVGALTMPAQ